MVPGSSAFGLVRDDVHGGGTASHPLGRHTGQAQRDPVPIGCQSGRDGAQILPHPQTKTPGAGPGVRVIEPA